MPLPVKLWTDKSFWDSSMFQPHQAFTFFLVKRPPEKGSEFARMCDLGRAYWKARAEKPKEKIDPIELPKDEEGLANEAFEWFCGLVDSMKFKYVYFNTAALFTTELADEVKKSNEYETNCRSIALSFMQVLAFVGFPMDALTFEASNLESDDDIKIVHKHPKALKASDVRGVGGIDAKYPWADKPFPEKDIDRTNGLKVKRTSKPDAKSEFGTLVVSPTNRDPFLNHYVCHVKRPFKFKYFDPLLKARYKNGQSDFFEAYKRKELLFEGKKLDYYVADDDESRIYELTGDVDPIAASPAYKKMVAQFAKDGVKDAKMWWIVDPEDHDDKFAPPTPLANPGGHPPLVREVYGLLKPGKNYTTLAAVVKSATPGGDLDEGISKIKDVKIQKLVKDRRKAILDEMQEAGWDVIAKDGACTLKVIEDRDLKLIFGLVKCGDKAKETHFPIG